MRPTAAEANTGCDVSSVLSADTAAAPRTALRDNTPVGTAASQTGWPRPDAAPNPLNFQLSELFVPDEEDSDSRPLRGSRPASRRRELWRAIARHRCARSAPTSRQASSLPLLLRFGCAPPQALCAPFGEALFAAVASAVGQTSLRPSARPSSSPAALPPCAPASCARASASATAAAIVRRLAVGSFLRDASGFGARGFSLSLDGGLQIAGDRLESATEFVAKVIGQLVDGSAKLFLEIHESMRNYGGRRTAESRQKSATTLTGTAI